MAAYPFVNYYQMLGILETDDCVIARAKVKAALIFTHPDKYPAALKDKYTEKSAVISTGFEVFSDEKSLKKWRRDHLDDIWKWFQKPASKNNKPMESIVPAKYLQWLNGENKWYELKQISKWRVAEQNTTPRSDQSESKQKAAEKEAHKQAQASKEHKSKTPARHSSPKTTKPKGRTEKSQKKEQKTSPAKDSTPPPEKSKTREQSHRGQKQSTQHKTSFPDTSTNQHSPNYDWDYIVIDDDDEQRNGPASRTRSKTCKTRTSPGAGGTNLYTQYANIPGYTSHSRKRKRSASDAGLDDVFVATVINERVRAPY